MNSNFVLGLLVGLTCVAHAYPNYPLLCSKLKPVQDLDLTKLQGSWLTVESLLLRDGFPEAPAKPGRRSCVRTTVFDATSSSLSMVSEVRLGTSRRRTGKTKFALNDRSQPGRWEMVWKRPTSLTTEMLVLAARPSHYLVLAYCQPTSVDADALEEGDRPALWIKILARDEGLDKQHLDSLRQHLTRMLGIKELTTVHFNTSC